MSTTSLPATTRAERAFTHDLIARANMHAEIRPTDWARVPVLEPLPRVRKSKEAGSDNFAAARKDGFA